MGGLGPLLGSLAAIDIAAMTHKLKRNAVVYAVISLFVLTAYGLAVAALAVYLGELWGLPIGLLAVAGGALVLALIVYASAALAARAEERRRRAAAAASREKTLMMTAALSALPMVMKSRTLLLASVAGGLGFLLLRGGRSSSDGDV